MKSFDKRVNYCLGFNLDTQIQLEVYLDNFFIATSARLQGAIINAQRGLIECVVGNVICLPEATITTCFLLLLWAPLPTWLRQ
jgi:hypothetical protein